MEKGDDQMANQSTCVRCGKPCAPGEIMCPECNQWFQEQTRGKSAGFKGNAKPQRPQTPPQVWQETKTTAEAPSPVQEKPFHDGASGQMPDHSAPPAHEEKIAFEKAPEQPAGPKKAAPKGKNRVWIPLATGGAAVIVIIAVVLAMVLKKPDESAAMQQSDGSGITGEEDMSGESTGSFLPETGLSDGEMEEEPEEQEPALTPDEENPAEKEPPEEAAATVACIVCGEDIPANALFCPYCGESQTATEEEEEPEEITVNLGSESDIDGSRFSVLPIQSADQSSVVVQSGTHDNTAAAAVDGKLETSWQEGVDGDGIGEWVRYNLGSTRTVQYLRLYLGNWRDSDWYSENNVPKELEIEVNGQIWRLEFPYGQEPCVVVWSAPVETDYVVLRVASVYEGSMYDDTCIAEVEIIGY